MLTFLELNWIKLESRQSQKSTMIAQHDEIQVEDYLNEKR